MGCWHAALRWRSCDLCLSDNRKQKHAFLIACCHNHKPPFEKKSSVEISAMQRRISCNLFRTKRHKIIHQTVLYSTFHEGSLHCTSSPLHYTVSGKSKTMLLGTNKFYIRGLFKKTSSRFKSPNHKSQPPSAIIQYYQCSNYPSDLLQ